jgi:hypothetical protein
MTFEQITTRLIQLGKDRAWLAQECDYSLAHIANALAPNGDDKAKTRKALRRMWEALDREEERQRMAAEAPSALGHRVVLEPTKEQFDAWTRCAVLSREGNLDDWAKAGLDAKAARELPALLAARNAQTLAEPEHSHLKVANDSTPYGSTDEQAQA